MIERTWDKRQRECVHEEGKRQGERTESVCLCDEVFHYFSGITRIFCVGIIPMVDTLSHTNRDVKSLN